MLRDVRLRDLDTDPDNPREGLHDLADLAASMAEVGLLQPIVARRAPSPDGERLVVVAGHRRLAAAQWLGWDTVPTIVVPPMRPDDVLVAMVVENSQRQDLDPIEEARAFARIQVERGLASEALVARAIGRTRTHVSERLRLLSLSVEDQERVRVGEMPIGHAVAKARVRAGRVTPSARGARLGHLSVDHPLARRARAACESEHGRRRKLVGSIACGQCWEVVIRADEAASATARSVKTGRCVTCDHALLQPAPGSTTDPTAAGEGS